MDWKDDEYSYFLETLLSQKFNINLNINIWNSTDPHYIN